MLSNRAQHLVVKCIIIISFFTILVKLGNTHIVDSKQSNPKKSQDRQKVIKRPERSKILSDKITEEELYATYKEVREDYYDKLFPGRSPTDNKSTGEWEVLREKDGVEVSKQSLASDPSCPYIRVTAILPGDIKEVWNFLSVENWPSTLPSLDPFYEGHNVIKDYRYKKRSGVVEMSLVRKRTKRLFTFGKRDFTILSVSEVPKKNGVWVSGIVSVNTKDVPRVKGYTRAFQDSISFYETISPEIGQGKQKPRTKVTIVFRFDLNDSMDGGGGGAIPMWLYVKTVGPATLASFTTLKKLLVNYFESKGDSCKQDKKSFWQQLLSRFLPAKKPLQEKDANCKVDDIPPEISKSFLLPRLWIGGKDILRKK